MQYGNEMSQLVLDVVRHRDRVGDLVLQQLPVALTQAVKGLFHGVFGHVAFRRLLVACDGSVRIHRTSNSFKRSNSGSIASGRRYSPSEPHEHLLQQCQRPTTFVNAIRAQIVGRLLVGALAREQFLQRNQRLGLRRV